MLAGTGQCMAVCLTWSPRVCFVGAGGPVEGDENGRCRQGGEGDSEWWVPEDPEGWTSGGGALSHWPLQVEGLGSGFVVRR